MVSSGRQQKWEGKSGVKKEEGKKGGGEDPHLWYLFLAKLLTLKDRLYAQIQWGWTNKEINEWD